MKMLLIGGLLGAGKTTLLLQLVRQLRERYSRIAVVENEVGEIGIDGRYLESEGLHVQELYSGCICCTLSVDLLQTLAKLQDLYNPELVVLEPSGAAKPGDVIVALRNSDAALSAIEVISVMDAVRFKVFREMLEPLVVDHLEPADVVVVTRTDQADPETLQKVLAEIRSLSKKARIFPLSLPVEPDLREIWEGWL